MRTRVPDTRMSGGAYLCSAAAGIARETECVNPY